MNHRHLFFELFMINIGSVVIDIIITVLFIYSFIIDMLFISLCVSVVHSHVPYFQLYRTFAKYLPFGIYRRRLRCRITKTKYTGQKKATFFSIQKNVSSFPQSFFSTKHFTMDISPPVIHGLFLCGGGTCITPHPLLRGRSLFDDCALSPPILGTQGRWGR